MNETQKDSLDDHRMTFGEHLEELRRRFIYCLIGVGLVFIVALFFQIRLVELINYPINDAMATLAAKGHKIGEAQYTGPTDKFLYYIKTCFAFAVLVGVPWILFQMWRFIGAGLYSHEQKAVMRVLPGSIILMFMGMAFGFFVLLPFGLQFLLGYGDDSIPVNPRMSEYFTFLIAVTLVMGFLFQLPLVMSVLTLMGMIQSQTFRKYRRHFIVGAFVAAAFLTPPDPGTQIMVGIPLLFLFEAGVWSSARIERRRKSGSKPDEADSKGGRESTEDGS